MGGSGAVFTCSRFPLCSLRSTPNWPLHPITEVWLALSKVSGHRHCQRSLVIVIVKGHWSSSLSKVTGHLHCDHCLYISAVVCAHNVSSVTGSV